MALVLVKTIGMIMTRGLGEMSRLAVELGANPQTFLGLSGVGDLITTCASPLSRNHKFGKYIGEGLTVESAKKENRSNGRRSKDSKSSKDFI